MQFIGHLIIRLIAIILGVSLALLAAGLFISFGVFTGMFEQLFADVEYVLDTELGNTNPLVHMLVILAGVLSSINFASLAIIPIFVAITLAEGMRWQGLTINLILGGVVSLFTGLSIVSPMQGTGNNLPSSNLPSDGTLVVLLAAGFIGGFVYWLIAGRSAGKWLGKEPASTPNIATETTDKTDV
ncbi:MAG: hypothetical protein AB8B49_11375 [Nitratireductor sp.]